MEISKNLVLLVKTDKKTNQTSTTVFASLYPAIKAKNKAARELRDKTTCKFWKNGFSTDDVKYQVVELGDVSWSRELDEASFEQDITERNVPSYGAVVQISKYKELNWTYIAKGENLMEAQFEPAVYYIQLCKENPDFTYKDYRFVEDESCTSKMFELYHKGDLLLTIYNMDYNNQAALDFGSYHQCYMPKQETFEKFVNNVGKAVSQASN